MGLHARFSSWFTTLLICCCSITFSVAAFAANVTTQKANYVPGETVVIHGSGWRAGEAVSLVITETPIVEESVTLNAVADANGNFTNSQFAPPQEDVGQDMLVTATGNTSGSATTIFANAAANLDQGRNEKPDDVEDPVVWWNGNLNDNQSHYTEGMSIPYRMVMTDLANGSHTLVIGWDTKDGNLAALDYLTHYDRLEDHSQFVPPHAAETVNPLQGLAGPFAGPLPYAVPDPSTAGTPVTGQPLTSFNSLPGTERDLTIWNGSITGATYNSQDPLNLAHSQSELTINFTSTDPTVVIAWGGHIARKDDWNDLAHPGGSPYHMRLISLDGQGGNQDRSLKSEAVLSCEIEGPTAVCAGSNNEYCVTTNIGGTKTYSWTFTANTSGASFVGPTNGACVSVNAGTGGGYSLKATVSGADGGITCEHSFTVSAAPSCAITGPSVVCPTASQEFCGPVGMASYEWSITGNGTFSTPANGQCVTVLAGAGCDASYTVSLKVTDGGTCNSICNLEVNVTDTQDPTVASCPPEQTIECPAIPSFGDPQFTDNCDANLTITSVDSSTPSLTCASLNDVTRTWTAKDDCGNEATCSQTIRVVDTTKPTFDNVPADATVECDNVPPPPVVTASDACDPSVHVELGEGLIILDSAPPSATACTYEITRTWTATDDCGNTATAIQKLTVHDGTKPQLVSCPPEQTIECPAEPSFGDPQFTDNCDTQLTVTMDDVRTNSPTCASAYDVTRTWTAKDNCNNEVTCSQTIHVVDTTKPTFDNVPADATVECDNVPPPPVVTASDACDTEVHVELGEGLIILDSAPPSATACTYEITRTWTATDDCGNTATASQKLTVHDGTKPQLVSCPPEQTIECPAEPSFGDPQFTDNCDTQLTVTMDDVRTNSPTCASAYDVTRTWTAKDNCNNEVTCSQTIHVVDTTKPTFDNVPADATVECDNVPPPPVVTASDACDTEVHVELGEGLIILDSAPPSATACTYEITRTWTATDDCGNTATASQKLTVHDGTKPQLVSCPPEQTIQCPAEPSFGDPQFTDNCDAQLTVTMDDVRTNSTTCANAYDVTRTWTAKDNCNNEVTCSQTIHVVDTTKPTFVNVPADATVECDNVPEPPVVIASDACDPDVHVELGEGLIILDSAPPSATACTYEITRTWTATDDCGNTATASQKLTVHDGTKPQLVSCPPEQTIECPAEPSFGDPQFTDNCDAQLTVTMDDVRTNSTTCANAYDVTRTWTAKDNCNNEVTCSQTIHVVDTTKPTLACPSDINVGECNVSTVTYTATANDACSGPVEVVFNPPSGSVFPVGTTEVTATATDGCGNTETCTFDVNVTGVPAATITGDDAVCTGQTAELCGPAGNYTWAWTGPGGYTAGTQCITVSAAGTYNLTVTADNSCSSTQSHELIVRALPSCSISGPTETCDGTPVQLCGPDGDYGYTWSGPGGFTADTRCINVSAAGDYSLVVTDLATKCSSDPCSHTLQVTPCVASCPRTPGFWAAQCDQSPTGQTKFDAAAMTSISSCVDDKVGIFNWSAETDFSRFCSTVSTGGQMDQRRQAKRQFASFLANMCTGQLGLIANNGDHIFLDPNASVSCSGLSSTTMGGLVTEVDNLLLSLEAQSLTNPVVKAKYSQVIACLDAINNAEGGSVCQSAQEQNAIYKDYELAAGLVTTTDVVELYRPSPNPFSSFTRIAYVVRGTGEHVHIGVYDVAGRKMKVLVDGFQSPGRYEMNWDGSSDAGARANNGVYFVRSVVAGQVKTMRVIYVK